MRTRLQTQFLPLLILILSPIALITIPNQGLGQGTSMTFTVNVIGDNDDPNAGEPGHLCNGLPGDSCSFRAAIENHNANRNLPQNTIKFAIPNAPGSGSIVIMVGGTGLGPFPPILGSVIITGLNDPGNGGRLRRIEIKGSQAGTNAIGMQLLGGQCEISFFIINSFSSHGIYISGTPPPGNGGHHLENNYIGTDSTGTIDMGNGGDGIFIENTPNNVVGGLGGRRNIISANKGYGIHILGRDSSVTGQANGGINNSAQANIIGFDFFMQKLLPNALDAVLLEDAPNNTIGGTGPNQGNTIGGTKNGVSIKGSFSEGISIQGNFIGIDGTGAKFVAGIFCRGGKQLSIEGNFLTNIDSVGVDLFVNASGNYNILKNKFEGDLKIGSKFRFGPGQMVSISYQNNFHTNNNLAFDVQESLSGTINWVVVGDTIRAGMAGANIIFNTAGNKNFTTNRWEGTSGIGFNYVGNIGPGLQAKLTQTSEVFANNAQEGVSGKITARGEFDITMADIDGQSNGKDACRLDFTVGAGASVLLNSTRNKYTLNGFAGLRLVSDGNNTDLIQVFIEKDIMDKNVTVGINLLNMKLKHSIDNCTITNNGGPGIELDGISNVDINGDIITGNNKGILINDAATASINGNTITGNGKGIALAGTGTGTTILGNFIFNNTGLGIDLGDDGVTPNHTGLLSGPNNFQNYPVLASASLHNSDVIIKGTLNSASNELYRLEFFSNTACNALGFGEGENFLGFKQVTTDSTGNVSFSDTLTGVSLSSGSIITSTATDSLGNSSEFSACAMAAALPLHLISFTAKANGRHIVLNWTTVLEQNLKYFEILHSSDGNTFYELGQERPSDNSPLQKNYTFIDQQPFPGMNFYRLQMVDLDNASVYSNIIAVKMDAHTHALGIFPDPASKEINVQLFAGGKFKFELVDANGRIVKKGFLQMSSNGSTVVGIGNLSKGIYTLILQNSKEKHYKKFIKQ